MSKNKYPKLFSEGYIGNIKIPNRVVYSAMGCTHAAADTYDDNTAEYFGDRAKGGCGLVFTGAMAVSSPDFDPYPFNKCPRFYSDAHFSRLSEVADLIRGYGAVAGTQLTLGFGQNTLDLIPENPPMSCSELPCKLDPNVKTRAMTKEDIKHKISDMARAAEMAYRAGFQIVEIHGHSGYLLEQFFNPATNFRTDEYGGSLENRFRICDEMVKAIREKVGNKIALTLRLSISHMAEGMMTFEDGLAIAKLAEKAGFDAINVDAGSYKAREWIVPPEHIDYHILEEMSKKAKAELSIPVIHAGGYQMPWQCEEALENDVLDFAGVARAMIADPDWCRKSKLGRENEIRACIRCNNCLHRVYADKLEQCAVNPTACRELKYRAAFMQSEEPKRLTVIGGGPAGMVAAIVAKRRGNEVTILERDEQLGGQLVIASKESFKTGVKYYKDYLIHQVEMRGINVELGCDVTAAKVAETDPDVVIVATGAETYVPDFIPGKEKAGVIDVKELYKQDLTGDEKIIVIGGGQTGAETALALGREGHEVHLLTRSDPDKFLRNAFDFRDLNCIYLGMMKELDKAGVEIHYSTHCKQIEDDHILCISEGEEFILARDLVITAMGTRPVNNVTDEIKAEFDDVYVLGDCIEPGNIRTATHAGFYAGLRV